MTCVAGVDGCPGGWLAVVMNVDQPENAAVSTFSGFADLLDALGDVAVIAVDMPIGLPERWEGRGRTCEVIVRARLGPRQSSVFAIPARAAVMQTDYREACRVSLATSDPPRKVSKQAFNLFPKIREIDSLWQPGFSRRVFECHPEAAFWALNGGAPMALPKKVKSRPNPDGLAERAGKLAEAGFDADMMMTSAVPKGAARDDLLDATVCAWSAARIVAGKALSLPDPPETDALGRPMAITI